MSTSKKYTSFTGPLTSIAPPSSPGMLLLAAYLPAIDALDRTSPAALAINDIVSPTATYQMNGGPVIPFTTVLGMLGVRSEKIERFTHEDFDTDTMDLEGENGKRKVVCECSSTSLFKGDDKNERVKVNELLILECEPAPEGKGIEGVWVVGAKSYFDPAPVREKGKEIMKEGKVN
ncbi:hypothetical protein BGZ60DRAFT_233224 [Tricladium varicosporioides]|nr:hypothetical protein BGZ60DRAFT_233224 [Hymenoscyphus varicosporioides]